MPRDCNIFSYISNEVPKVVLHLLAIPHQSLLCKVIVLMRELSVDFCSQSPGGNSSEHKAQGCPHDLRQESVTFVLICLHVPRSLTFYFYTLFFLFPGHPKWFSQPVLYFSSIITRLARQNYLRQEMEIFLVRAGEEPREGSLLELKGIPQEMG